MSQTDQPPRQADRDPTDLARLSVSLSVRGQHLIFDPASRRVWLKDEELTLTPREFDVLLYLVSRAGCLVTSAELLNAVWGSSDVIGNAALRTVIKRLRCKLGDHPQKPRYISNVHGQGYRFDP
jgi:two-component system KDP operon response regulator KdpE